MSRSSGPRASRTVALFLLGAALLLWFVVIPYPWRLESRNPGPTAVMKQRLREAAQGEEPIELRHEWVPLDRISPHLQRAVVMAEDDRFRVHHGVDWLALADELHWTGDEDFSWTSTGDLKALARAIGYGWTHRSEIRGRSTITQQVAKNLYFGLDRSVVRKGVEMIVAKRLERHLEKDRILEIYLNIAEWGPGIFGAEAAAQAHFGRSASELSRFQAAALAATLPHPLSSNPSHNPGRMAWRRDLILQRMSAGPGAAPAPIPPPDPELVLESLGLPGDPSGSPPGGPSGDATGDATGDAPGGPPGGPSGEPPGNPDGTGVEGVPRGDGEDPSAEDGGPAVEETDPGVGGAADQGAVRDEPAGDEPPGAGTGGSGS